MCRVVAYWPLEAKLFTRMHRYVGCGRLILQLWKRLKVFLLLALLIADFEWPWTSPLEFWRGGRSGGTEILIQPVPQYDHDMCLKGVRNGADVRPLWCQTNNCEVQESCHGLTIDFVLATYNILFISYHSSMECVSECTNNEIANFNMCLNWEGKIIYVNSGPNVPSRQIITECRSCLLSWHIWS